MNGKVIHPFKLLHPDFLSAFHNMLAHLQKLMAFLKSPVKADKYTDVSAREFLFLLLMTLCIVIPYALLLEAAGIDQFDNKLEELLKNNKWLTAILAIFLVPLLEEPVYRLHLDFKIASIWWSLVLSLLLISETWYPLVLLWIWLLFLLYKVIIGEQPNLKFAIFTSSALFALVHMGNFAGFDYSRFFYWIPFMVGTQFLGGLILSYIRLNFGMKWAIIFHGVYNAVLIIPAVYFYDI